MVAPGRNAVVRGSSAARAHGVRAGVRAWAGSRRAAAAAAVFKAQRPVVTQPKRKTSPPKPASSHQPGLLAAVKPARSDPCRPDVRSEPVRATPSDWPTWRLVEARPAATPDWATGMPDTAALVIGVFTMPNPTPKMT